MALALAAGLAIATSPAGAKPVTVFGAASLKTAMDEIAVAWENETGVEVVASYAASSALAQQIEQGAPADIFISADVDWMDELQQKDLIDPASRIDLLGNRIVLVAPKDANKPKVQISQGFDLAGLLGDNRLAVAETTAVPAGRYAKAALESLGIWDSVADKLAQGENVRATLLFVARGEAPLGIVYRTDAAAEPEVKILGTFPADSHPAIMYPAAIVASSDNPDAKRFLDHLLTAEAMALFQKQGFDVLQ